MEKHVGGIVCYNGEPTGVTTPERNCLIKVLLGALSTDLLEEIGYPDVRK